MQASYTITSHLKGFFGLWWAVMTGLWTLISSADLLVNKYAPKPFVESWNTQWIAPKWGWQVWVIGFLAITLGCAFVSSFRGLRSVERESQQREDALRRELAEEIAKRGRPEVIVTCDWPSMEVVVAPTMRTLLQRQLAVKILSEIPAMDVQIENIVFGEEWTARFEVVRLLDKSTPEQKVRCYINREKGSAIATTPTWDLEALICHIYGHRISNYNDTLAPSILVIARYKDSHGTAWESVNELHYDLFLRKGEVRHIEIRKLG